MARDLDAYTVPGAGGKGVRRTDWNPWGIELERKASSLPCACPCRLAHPHHLADGCDQTAPSVAHVAVGSAGPGSILLPLCAACAAAQLHGRWKDAKADVAAWKYAESAPALAAVLAVIVAVVTNSWPIAGIAGGLVLSTFVFPLVHEWALRKRRYL